MGLGNIRFHKECQRTHFAAEPFSFNSINYKKHVHFDILMLLIVPLI